MKIDTEHAARREATYAAIFKDMGAERLKLLLELNQLPTHMTVPAMSWLAEQKRSEPPGTNNVA